MRVGAHLADDAQLVEPFDERGTDRRALPQQTERFGIAEPLGELIQILGVIAPNGDIVMGDLLITGQGAKHVLVIVEQRDVHGSGAEVRESFVQESTPLATTQQKDEFRRRAGFEF